MIRIVKTSQTLAKDHLMVCVLNCFFIISFVGCRDDKMHRKHPETGTKTLERISPNYSSNSKAEQFTAKDISQRSQNQIACQETASQLSHRISETKTTQRLKNSLAHKLAKINARGYVSSDDMAVLKFHNLLVQMSGKFTEDEQQIADMSVKALELLENEGVTENLINIMEGLNTLPVTARDLPSSWHEYRQYVALYVSARTKLSHEETIKGLQAFIVETLRLTRQQ